MKARTLIKQWLSSPVLKLVHVLLLIVLGLGVLWWAISGQPAKAQSTIIYVRPGGDDVNCNGTTDEDYPGSGGPGLDCAVQTIEQGVISVTVGGTVSVAAGTYQENVVVDKSLTLQGAGIGQTILDGNNKSAGGGVGIQLDPAVSNVNIYQMTITRYASGIHRNANGAATENIVFEDLSASDNYDAGIYFSGNAPARHIRYTRIIANDNDGITDIGRGIFMQSHDKENVVVEDGQFRNNRVAGIDLNIGVLDGVRIVNNTVSSSAESNRTTDSGIGILGLVNSGTYTNEISGNNVSVYGRFGIEIKGAQANGAMSGPGSFVVAGNTISHAAPGAPLNASASPENRDLAGIAVGDINNSGEPNGVVLLNNTVSGFRQYSSNTAPDPDISTGFCISVSGANYWVEGNNVDDCDVGIQEQQGFTGTQNTTDDEYFGRDNSTVACGTVTGNSFGTTYANMIDQRQVGDVGEGVVTNTDIGKGFCAIQAAIDDDETLSGHTLNIGASVYRELITVTKSLTLAGEPGTIIQPSENIPDFGSNHDGAIIWIQAPDVTIRDMLIDGDNPDIDDGYDYGDANINAARGIYMSATAAFDQLLVENVTLHNLGRGINLYGGQNHTLRNNVAHNLGGPDGGDYGYGILLNDNTSAQISSNTIDLVLMAGIFVQNNYSTNPITITGNTVTDARIGLGWNMLYGGNRGLMEHNTVIGGEIGVQVTSITNGYLEVRDNTITLPTENNEVGFLVWNTRPQTVLITGNTVNGSDMGVLLEDVNATFGPNQAHLQLTHNTFNGSITAIEVSSNSIAHSVSLTATGNVIHNTSTGLNLSGTETIDHITFAGNALDNTITAFSVSTMGGLYAYANNVTGFTTGINDPAEALNARHNWWGTYSEPTGVNTDSWNFRLGAPVAAWGMGTLDDAALTSADGTGTGIIVSHADNAPFGRTLTPYVNTPCSDYYDFFVLNADEAWTVRVPLDTTRDECNIVDLPLYHFALTPGGWPDDACSGDACWQALPGAIRDGDALAVTVEAMALLQGTPFVASNGNANLVVSKTNFRTTVQPGETLAYLITITNTGNATATVSVTDTLPTNTAFLVASNGGTQTGSGVVTWPAFNLSGNDASTTRLVVVTLGNSLPAGVEVITNTVTATTPNEEDETDNTAWYTNTVNAAPVLTLGKSDGEVDAMPGETLVYTLTYANVGTQHATGVVITETVPEHTTFAGPAGPDGWSCAIGATAGTTCTYAIDDELTAGSSGNITFIVDITTPLPAGVTHIHNTATIADDGSNSADLNPVSRTATLATPVVAAPDLEISKSNGEDEVIPGQTLVYTLVVTNTGTQDAANVVVTDYLPAHTASVVASDSGGLSAPGVVTWPPFALPGGGASETRSLTVTVAAPFPAATNLITNTATVANEGITLATAVDGDTVNAAPILALSKDNDVTTVTPGSTLIYRLVITNSGNQLAAGIVLTDTLPEHTAFVLASHDGLHTTPGVVVWPTFDLPGGTSTTRLLVVTMDNPLPAGVTAITNFAELRDNRGFTLDAMDIDAVEANPEFILTKTSAVTTTPGAILSYTLILTNTGNQNATGVVITDTLPAEVIYVGASDGGSETAPGSGIVVWPPFSLASGDSVTYLLTVEVDATIPAGIELLINTIEAVDDLGHAATNQHVSLIHAAPDLVLTKTDGGLAGYPGETLEYTLTYTNTGDQDATGVVIEETVPAHTTFNSAASAPDWDCPDGAPAGTICAYPVGAVGADETGDVTFAVDVVMPLPAGVTGAENLASITDDGRGGEDANPDDNVATLTTPIIAAPNLVVSKDNHQTEAYPGDTLAYLITITNTGSLNAASVLVTDTLPLHTTFVSASDGGQETEPDSGIVTWPAFSLAGNGVSVTRLVIVTVDNPVLAGVDRITNTVTAVTLNDIDPDNNTAWDVDDVIAAPDLALTKRSGSVTVEPGDALAYTLIYANIGNQEATGIVITETVPAHTSFNQSDSTPGWTCDDEAPAGTLCTYPFASLTGGASGETIFAVTIDPSLPSGVAQIENTASIADDGANGVDPSPENNTANAVTPVIAIPDLMLAKSDNGVTTTPGATLLYTLTYVNVGNQGATGVVITETVPAHTTFNTAGSSPGWSCDDGALAGTICTNAIGSLPAGSSGDRQFAVNVIYPALAGVTQIDNTATIADDGSNGADPTPADNTTSTTTPVQATPDLEISKSNGVDTVEPGDTLVYTLTVANTGPQGATGIRITDYLPAHTTFESASDGGEPSAPGIVSWPLFDLPGGGVSVIRTLTVIVDNPFPVDTNVITNTATVADDGANGPDPTTENNTATDVDDVFAAPDLLMSKDNGLTTVTPGSTLTYRLIITNSGSQLAAGIVLTDTLPEHTTFSLASDGGQETEPGSGIVVWPTFDLPGNNASVTRLLVVTVDTPLPAGVTAITNTAVLHDNRGNTATAADFDAVNANPLLVLDKTNAVDSVVPGETVVYTLTLTNNGNQEATGIVITDTLPDDVTFVAASDGGYTTSSGIVVWPPFNLAGGGASVTRTLTVYVNPTLPAGLELLINTAQASDDRGYTAFAQHADRVIATPDLEISKSNGVDTVVPGAPLTYQIVITNSGPQGATGIRITDYLPAHTTFESASDGGEPSAPGIVSWPLFDLPGGGVSVTHTLTVIVDNPFPVDTNVITNTATVADDGANGPDPTPDNNTAVDVDTVFAAPILALSKSNDVTTVTPGSTLIYRLVITNSGTQLAAGIVLTDTLPEHTAFYLASDNGSESGPGIVTWPAFSLPAGNSTTRLLVVTVDNPLPAGVTAITNFAALRDNRDNVAEAQDTDAVDANPLLALDKTNAVDDTVPGATLVYTLTLTNNGNQEATGILITDTLPADVTFIAASDGGYTASPGIVVWPPFNLAGGGASVIRTLTVAVNPTLPAGLELLINTAQASEDRGYTAFAQHADLVIAAPDLSITKTDGDVIPRPGDVLVYTLTYANVGNQGATGVVIAETVPAYTTFDAAASSPGWTCADGAPAGTSCAYTAGDLPAGDSDDITFAVRVANPLPVNARQTANAASIADDGNNGADTDPANNTVSIITPFNATIDLFITKDDGGVTVEPGETIVYTLTYGNNGDQIAGGVVITEIVPALTTFNQTASSLGWTCAHGSPAGTICTYPLGDIIEGGALLFAVEVVLPFPLGVSEISNQVIIGADANNIPDANPNNNIATAITPIITRPDLVAGKDDGVSVVLPDQQITYVITVTNVGTQNSTNVQITDTLPDHVAFAGASDGGAQSTPGIVTWPPIPQITLDEVVTRTLSVIVNSTLPAGVSHITNTVTVSDDGTHGPDLNPDNNTATDVNFVGAMPDLVLYKTVNRATIYPTGLLVYTIRVENTGSQGATGVSIVDTLPANTNFVSASDGGYESATGVVTWPAFALNVGEQVVRSLTVRTAPALPEDYELTNTAIVSDDGANGEDPTPENNTDTATSVIKWPIVYLPVVLRNYAIGPDLIVEDIVVGGGTIAITIKNQGKLAVPNTIGFWVDLYINPSPAPTRVNQTWDPIAPYGAAWAVDREALAGLLPDQSYTLYLYDRYYQPNFSRLPAALRAGDVIYAQVDSFNAATTYGVVWEDHEMGGWEYNNIRRRIIDEPIPLNPVTSMQHVPTSPEAGAIPERP